jgi:hypothetical protein
MALQGSQLGRPVLGPFKVYTLTGVQPAEVCNIPFSQVVGGQIAISIQDNLAGLGGLGGQQVISNNLVACAVVEVSIVGQVMGISDTLACVALRMITGPLCFQFVDGLSYQDISIRARMVRGGLPELNPSAEAYSAGTEFTAQLGYTANLTVTLQPRMEFATPPKRTC